MNKLGLYRGCYYLQFILNFSYKYCILCTCIDDEKKICIDINNYDNTGKLGCAIIVYDQTK